MAERNFYYKNRLIFAVVLLLCALGMIGCGWYLVASGPGDGGFALVFIGLFVAVMAVLLAGGFLIQERHFQKAMQEPLLAYRLDPDLLQNTIETTAAGIRAQAKRTLILLLIIVWIICGAGVVVCLFLEEGAVLMILIILICLALAVFMLFLFPAATSYRVWQLEKGGAEVVISRGGALVLGQFHAWRAMGSGLLAVNYQPAHPASGSPGQLDLVYSGSGQDDGFTTEVHVMVPPEYDEDAIEAAVQLKQAAGLDEGSVAEEV